MRVGGRKLEFESMTVAVRSAEDAEEETDAVDDADVDEAPRPCPGKPYTARATRTIFVTSARLIRSSGRKRPTGLPAASVSPLRIPSLLSASMEDA